MRVSEREKREKYSKRQKQLINEEKRQIEIETEKKSENFRRECDKITNERKGNYARERKSKRKRTQIDKLRMRTRMREKVRKRN